MELTAFRIRSMRYIAFICAIVVWGWGFLTMSSLAGTSLTQIFLFPALLALPLLIAALIFASRSRHLPGPGLFTNKRQLLLYLSIVVLTVIGYIVVRLISLRYLNPQWIAPGATFIVGLHFLSLIPIFKSWWHSSLTALVLCMVSILVPIFLPQTYTLGTLHVVYGWQFAISIVCLLWLWITGVSVLILGTQLLRGIRI